MKVNLFFNWYKCESVQRQLEIDTALKKNREVFDNVILVTGRPTFSELFALTKDYPEDINCFCNSDIYFEDISRLKEIKEEECFALCRWNIWPMVGGKPVLFGRSDSQDSWIFKGTIKPIQADFTQGLWGCDNRLAYEIEKAAYSLKNPSLSIKTIHLHAVDKRSHKRTEQNTVPHPYTIIEPTYL